MIKKTAQYLWNVRAELFRYGMVGVSGLFLDFGTLIFFKESLGFSAVSAVALNQVIVLTYNFLLNKYWSFKNKAVPTTQLMRYATLALFNYSFSVFVMALFHDRLGFDYRLVRLGAIVVMVSWNFFLYKYWVYRSASGTA